MKKDVKIVYEQYSSHDELPAEDGYLIQLAIEAMGRSYSPYSGFSVGAAVRLSDGRIVLGANQENAAYPSGLCAERVALFAAHSVLGEAHITALAVAGGPHRQLSGQPVFPCGACAQVLLEFEHPDDPVQIVLIGADAILKLDGAASLLPFGFKK